jgi:hypothetical protein
MKPLSARSFGPLLGVCALTFALGLSAAPGAHAANLLSNHSFEMVGPAGPVTSATTLVPGGAGWSAAANWGVFHNTPGTTRTRLLPSTLPGGGATMIHVLTTGLANGLVQTFLPVNTGPKLILGAVRVFVLRGKVAIGTGNGGNTHFDAVSTTMGQWEILHAPNGVAPANEFIIYAASAGGAEFFVDNALVDY